MVGRKLMFLCVSILALFASGKKRNSSPPHLIMILADDLGWNDVSWHNPHMITPNMEVRNVKYTTIPVTYKSIV